MLRPLGQASVDLTGYPCLSTDLCKSGGDASLMCCASIPGAPGGTCRSPSWCSQAGYQEQQPPALPAQPTQEKDGGPSVLEQIVIGVAVAVGVGFILQSLSKTTGRSYTMNAGPTSVRSRGKEREAARSFWRTLSPSERGEIGDQLVLGDVDYLYWFGKKPSSAFLNELDRERMLWEA